MENILKLTVVVTSVDIGTPVELDETPLLGGQGRKAILRMPVNTVTGVFKLQGNSRDPDTKAVPAEDDSGWTDILSVAAATTVPTQEIELPEFIRWNVTTADADGPDVLVYLEGIQ